MIDESFPTGSGPEKEPFRAHVHIHAAQGAITVCLPVAVLSTMLAHALMTHLEGAGVTFPVENATEARILACQLQMMGIEMDQAQSAPASPPSERTAPIAHSHGDKEECGPLPGEVSSRILHDIASLPYGQAD